MGKKLKVKIMPDGRVVAETVGVTGEKCVDIVKSLEKMVEGKIVKMEHQPEFYQPEKITDSQTVKQQQREDK